jgi:hypothetical protein
MAHRITPTILDTPAAGGKHEVAEITTRVQVSPEQAAAFKSLPKDLQEKLGPPVFGQVLSATELKRLVKTVRVTETSSTIMCPW